MAVEIPVEKTDPSSAEVRVVHLSAYVDLPISAVLDRFAAPEFPDLLAASVLTALEAPGADVTARIEPPAWVSGLHARVPVSWRITGRSGRSVDANATVSLLVLRSGRDAITEILLAVPFRAERVIADTEVAHRVLTELAGRLEAPISI